MRPLLPAKEVRVDGLHLERLNRANPHVVVDHVVRELIPGPSAAARVTSAGGGLEPPRDYRRSVPRPMQEGDYGPTRLPSPAKQKTS
jgi:hypothetical protein